MYKLILADDEEDVREGLLQLIDWDNLGFQVSDTAENGKEAAELVDKHLPDIVVTDIQMPFMSGLELSEWIRATHPDTKIIILTGYEEFEYAQKAIRLGIDEYLLKPFSAGELAAVLHKVKEQMDAERAARENIQLLTEHYRKNLPVLQSLFLSSLVSRRLPQMEIREKSRHYNLELEGAGYMISVLRIDDNLDINSGGKPEAMASERDLSHSLRATNDTQLQLFAVLNIANEIIRRLPGDQVFIHHDGVVLLSIFDSAVNEQMVGRSLDLLEEIRYSVERYLKLTITIGAGMAVSDIGDVFLSYQDALRALDYRLILGSNKVIWINDVESRQIIPFVFDEVKEKELIRCLKVGTDVELAVLLDDLFGGLLDSRISYQDFQVYLLMMLTAVIKASQDVHADMDKLFGDGALFLGQLSKLSHAIEAKTWFAGICMKLKHSIASERQTSYNKLVEEAKEYIQLHFGESDISITKVCKQLHISTGYFSNIFKKETSMTFVNYLMSVRMESAQQLLRTTDLKSFEIAEKVGFTDPNYFSFCFRKKFGISPKEYRSGAGKA